MSLFGPETERLHRTSWKSVDQLAEELYALFNGKSDLFQQGRIILQPDPNRQDAPLQINLGSDPNGPAVTINNGGVNTTIGGNTDGGLTFGGVTFNPPGDGTGGQTGTQASGDGGGTDVGKIDFGGDQPPDPNSVPPAGQAPFTLYGEVQSKISGNQYSVKLWARDPYSKPSIATLAVRFPYVDPDDTIPPNFPCPVICFPGATLNNSLGIEQAISFVPLFAPAA